MNSNELQIRSYHPVKKTMMQQFFNKINFSNFNRFLIVSKVKQSVTEVIGS